MSALPSYREVVGDQAIELERRMQAAGVRIELTAGVGGWCVKLTLGSGKYYEAQAPILARALWLAALTAGLTEGLNPPPRSGGA